MSFLGVIGAIATLVGAGINYINAKETNETNQEINESNNEFNKQEREASQVYNSASSMVERGKLAGLNRMAAIGLPASSPASAASPIGMEAPKFDIGDIGNKVASAEQAESSAESQAADARLKDEQTKGVAISNSYAHEREYSNLLKTYESIDNLKMDTEEKEAQKKYLLTQMEHLRSMSPILAEGQRNVNRLTAAQTDESIQNVAESKARVSIAKAELKLKEKSVLSQLNLNAAQASQLRALVNKYSVENAHIAFTESFDERCRLFYEFIEQNKFELQKLNTDAKVAIMAQQFEMLGFEKDKMERINSSEVALGCQRLLGISLNDIFAKINLFKE